MCGEPKCRSNKCPLWETTLKKDWAINEVAAKEQLHTIVATPALSTDATTQDKQHSQSRHKCDAVGHCIW